MMKTLVVLGFLLYVSLYSLAAVIEVFEEAESVLLPCFYGGVVPEDPSVIWTRNGPNPRVFLLRQGGDDPTIQNQIYRERTSMNPDALDTGNYSLTFKDPQLSDSGNYVCSISDGIKELKLTEVQLNVKDDQMEVKMYKDAKSVMLPCTASANLPKDTKVEWTRSEPEFVSVHAYPHTSRKCTEWEDLYCGRTRMNEDLLRTGDLSLILRFPSDRDSGRYICTVYRDKDTLRQRVVLEQVTPIPLDPESLPTWATVPVVLIVLLVLAVSAGVLYHFRQHFMSVPQVEVESRVESVLLPCRTTYKLPADAKVEWIDRERDKVHVYQNGSDQPEEQNQYYRTRTRMNEDLLRTGDFGLFLRWPTDGDTNIYTCIVYSGDEVILMKKQVNLKVKVHQQIKVDSGVESVVLPCKNTVCLPEDCKVEWKNERKTAYVNENGSYRPEKLSQFYRTRTRMKEDLLRTGDLCLTLEHPTDEDSGIYTCKVYSREGDILIKKQVKLEVKACVVEVEEGAESVLLPFITTPDLPGDAEVEWRRGLYVAVHVYQNSSDLPEKQNRFYRDRTRMNGDLLRTGDLSLTLRRPTVRDSGRYRCDVYSFRGNFQREKTVLLRVKEKKQDHDHTPLLQYEV